MTSIITQVVGMVRDGYMQEGREVNCEGRKKSFLLHCVYMLHSIPDSDRSVPNVLSAVDKYL